MFEKHNENQGSYQIAFLGQFLMHLLTPGFDAAGLRVGDVMEDEDLLNVALWEERANKQWCNSAVFRLWRS